MPILAIIFLAFVAIGTLFQLALALGAPLGEYTLGGKFPGKLPPKLRIAALAQILVLFVFAFIVLIRSGVVLPNLQAVGRVGIWFVVAFFVLGSIANLSTPSKRERLLWGPTNVIMLAVSILIALSS